MEIELPDGWEEIEVGDTLLYFAPEEHGKRLVFTYSRQYYGGDHLAEVHRITADQRVVDEFAGQDTLGRYRKAENVLQDRINRWPDTVGSE